MPDGYPICLQKNKNLLGKNRKQLLKQFPKYNSQSFANIITGNETWVHFYESKRNIQNKIWSTKGGKRPSIAKYTMSIKEVMYVIFFTNQDPAIQIAVPKGKAVNARFYKGKIIHKLKKYFLNRRPATGLRGVRLLHDNASSHKAVIVREYLKQEKVVELPHLPYSPGLAPCDFLCPCTKSGGVLCYTLQTSECLSVRQSVCPSIRQWLIIRVRSITLIPFEIISRNLAQI